MDGAVSIRGLVAGERRRTGERRGPGFARDGQVVRQRLIDLLAERWIRTLVLVEAAGGFGKSTALQQAIDDNAADPTGLDVYHACRPPDRDAAHLVAALLSQLGSSGARQGETGGADLLAAHIARRAPTDVCLVLDDVHHLVDAPGPVSLLVELLRALPTNGHLVLSGRTLPTLPLSRLTAADDLVRMGADDLAFDPDEIAALAAGHDVDPEVLHACAGWPAMTRLALAAGPGVSIDYLFEEVVADLDEDTRLGLGALILARRADDDLLRRVGARATVADLLADVPLVTEAGDGEVAAHDLWQDAIDRLLDEDRLRELAVTVAGWHLAHERHDDALDLAVRFGAWPEAKRTVMAAVRAGDALLTAERVQRWLDGFPGSLRDDPEVRLLRAIAARLTGTPGAGDDDADGALDGFRASGAPEDVMAAGFEVGIRAWHRGDIGRVLEMYAVAEELKASGFAGMDPVIALVQSGMADLQGDVARARDIVGTIDVRTASPEIAMLALQSYSTYCSLLGDTAAAVEAAERLLDMADNDGFEFAAAAVHWQHGDPEPVRGRWHEIRGFVHDNPRYDFPVRAAKAVVDAAFGISADVSGMEELLTGRSREATMLAVATVASFLADGREDEAAKRFDQLADEVGVDDRLCLLELRRSFTYAYVLSPRFRVVLDQEDLGPTHVERRRLARLLLAAREGRSVDWTELPPPGEVVCAFPLPWTLEVAAYAAAAGGNAHLELVEFVAELTGASVQSRLRDLAAGGGRAAAGAAEILAAVPAHPAEPTTIRFCGPLTVERPGGVDADLLRRTRVRELLALLVLRTKVTALEAIDVLWPHLPRHDGRNNLRITMSFLRTLLEPDRHTGEAPFHVRRRDDDIRLQRSRFLDVDVWSMRDDLARGRKLERDGLFADAVEHYRAAIERWTGDAFPELRDQEAVRAEIIGFDEEVAAAAARVAEWSLAQGDTAGAVAAAERLLRHEPYAERAHTVLISVHLAEGDLDAAEDAVARLRAGLAELGVAPTTQTAMVIRRFERRHAPLQGEPAETGSPRDPSTTGRRYQLPMEGAWPLFQRLMLRAPLG